ncbi:hypothetical protein [Thermomonas haemolytica]|uniref:Uncharacterized protein n=1 Tax=Thermomonas haemolytica TaxID=141949 RepID=A0A4V2V2T1_9GAMM|nr:hypothetical protein [Thermomonas haemolytica]TCT26252.1 hypothetical protein EDC34_101581 [Thermomonas haemolytica]TNY28317.1 hypothetical protein BV505_11080 [Thermomonas haemolytica]
MDEHDARLPRDDALAHRLRQHWDAATPRVDQREAWRRLQAQLPPAPAARKRPRLAERLAEWRSWWLPTLSFASGAACAALALALLAPMTLSPARAPAAFEPLAGPAATTPAAGTRLAVAFAADARLADINTLLLQLQASVVQGPSALGLYTLEVAPDMAEQALQRLQSSPLVDSATLAPAS